ncbi:MAG: MBL fold metallo-hydrolase [Planctomycetes bacterium]|nr:MBL fold metallo-hydrolase [Planctomycetota bacterium]
MRLLVLGTAGYHPNQRRDTSCFLLPEPGWILDAGTGMHRVRRWLNTRSLDIFLSHAHLDHIVGLTFLPDVVWNKNVTRVTVHAEPAKLAAIERHLYAPDLFPLRPDFQQHPLDGAPFVIEDCRISTFPLRHPGGSLGFRFDWPDRSLAYVTDTTAAADSEYLRAIRGVDLLIHECNFRDGDRDWAEKTGHSHTSAVAELAAAAGVGRLLMTHFNPLDDDPDPVGLEAARRIFPRTLLAEEGMELDF